MSQKNDIQIEIESVLASKGTNTNKLEHELGLTKNTLGNMLRRGSVRYDVVKTLAKAIGKRIVWVDL